MSLNLHGNVVVSTNVFSVFADVLGTFSVFSFIFHAFLLSFYITPVYFVAMFFCLMHFFYFVLHLFISTTTINCLVRLVSKMCCVVCKTIYSHTPTDIASVDCRTDVCRGTHLCMLSLNE